MPQRFPSFIVAAGLCLFSSLIPSDVEGAFVSAKAMGMGGVGTARPQDSLCAAYNPAGMVYVGTRVDFGVHWMLSDPRTDVSGSAFADANGSFQGTRGQNFGTPDFGVNYMVFDSCDVSIGLVAYTRDWFKASYAETFPALGTSKLTMEFWQGVLSPVFSIRFDRFSFGISANFVEQRLKVTGLENFDTLTYSASPGNVTNNKESYTGGITYTLGGMWRPTDCFHLGAMYQFRGANHHFRRYRGLVGKNGELDLPTRIAGGFYWKVLPSYGIGVDLEHVGWNRIRWWHNKLPDTLAGVVTNPFGGPKGPGFGWEDQTTVRVGTDIQLNQNVIMRLGYSYGKSPVQKDSTLMNAMNMNVIDQTATLGFTAKITSCQEITAYYAAGLQRTIKGKPIGTDFGGGTYDLTNQQQHAGISYGCFW